MSRILKEKDMFCFEAQLKKVGKDEYFRVPYKVLAEDQYVAKAMLEDWLKDPTQTGYKYEYCDCLIQQPSDFIILAENKRPIESYTREINKVLGGKDTVWLSETDLGKVRKILSEIDNKFGKEKKQ